MARKMNYLEPPSRQPARLTHCGPMSPKVFTSHASAWAGKAGSHQVAALDLVRILNLCDPRFWFRQLRPTSCAAKVMKITSAIMPRNPRIGSPFMVILWC
jgi:hypothetical protein